MARLILLESSPLQSTGQKFITYILCSLGGTLISSILLGIPAGWFANDSVMLCYILAFIAMIYLPSSIFLLIFKIPLLFPLLLVMEDINFIHSMTTFGIDRTLLLIQFPSTHKSMFSCIIIGILSCIGGGLLKEFFSLLQLEWNFKFPHHLFSPLNKNMKLAIILSILYYLSINANNILSVTLLNKSDAKLLLIIIAISQLSGKRLIKYLSDNNSNNISQVNKSSSSSSSIITTAKTSETNSQQSPESNTISDDEKDSQQNSNQNENNNNNLISNHQRVDSETSQSSVKRRSNRSKKEKN